LLSKISSFRIRNFRLFDDVTLEPAQDVTILLGANNSGKSNAIDALAFLKDCNRPNIGSAFQRRHGFERIVSRHDMNSKAIIDLTFDDGASYAVTLRAGEAIHVARAGGSAMELTGGNQLSWGHGNRNAGVETLKRLIRRG